MEKVKEIYRLFKMKWNRIGRHKRNKALLHKDVTIISNNCFAGLMYQHLDLPYLSPTIGLYFFSDEYIRFLQQFTHYIHCPLTFIPTEKSKYYDTLKKLSQEDVLIGVLEDVEIVFLHYTSPEEALEKWNRRVQRINYQKIIFKFNDQNNGSYENLQKFDALPFSNKICFVSKDYSDIKCKIWMKKYRKKPYVLDDAYFTDRYIDMTDYINQMKVGSL